MVVYLTIIILVQIIVFGIGMVGLKRFRALTVPLRYLLYYILSEIIISAIKLYMMFHRIHTLWLHDCFTVLELGLFLLLYSSIWRNKRKTKLLLFSAVLYSAIWIISKFTFEPFAEFNTYTGAMSQVLQIGFGTWLLIFIVQSEHIYWKNDPQFLAVAGIVFYTASTFFLFGLFNEMLHLSQEMLRKIWMLNDLFIVMEHLFFLRAFLCKPERNS